MARTIAQIIPAVGWYVRYELNEGSFIEEPLACWVLAASDGKGQTVFGMDSLGGFCEDNANFRGYVHESEIAPGQSAHQP